jgi:hypothetical protein
MKAYGGMHVYIHVFLILKVSGRLHTPAALPPKKDSHYPLDKCWVGPRTGVENVEQRQFLILPGLELRPLCRPAHSQSQLTN